MAEKSLGGPGQGVTGHLQANLVKKEGCDNWVKYTKLPNYSESYMVSLTYLLSIGNTMGRFFIETHFDF